MRNDKQEMINDKEEMINATKFKLTIRLPSIKDNGNV